MLTFELSNCRKKEDKKQLFIQKTEKGHSTSICLQINYRKIKSEMLNCLRNIQTENLTKL